MDPFVYQYVLGTLVFGVGIWFAWRQGYVGLRGGRPGRSLALLVGGLLGFAALQAYLQYADMPTAPAGEYRGTGKTHTTVGNWADYAVIVAYFAAILVIGTWSGRRQRTLDDFFYAGRRFSWWLIAFSLVATVVGSYSFVKYSRVGYEYGVSSSQTYLNDWFWMPLFWFSWLPILYFSGVGSIPEYFQRRFGSRVRGCVTVILLVYLVGYIGVNLYTMGTALHFMLGWPIPVAALVVAAISGTYVTSGGQTSVIVTDLFQGVMLLVTGALIFGLGAHAIGGLDELWTHLPRTHRTAFDNFNEDPSFNSVGIFWQDGMANTAMFYFLNQGVVMRFLAARHVADGRRAMVVVPLILMPIAACVVASGGWVGRALEHAGALPAGMDPAEAFFITAEFIGLPGVYGLVLATLTAALMSTIDTLITGVSAIVVNDVYRPYVRPNASEREYLRVARFSAVGVTLLGLLLVPLYMSFRSIYAAHGAFTAAVTPPLVATFLLTLLWRRFTAAGAVASLVGGVGAVVLSIAFPQIIAPIAHGVPTLELGDGWLPGLHQYKFMRALFGLSASFALGIVVALITRRTAPQATNGLVWGTVATALARYKGRAGDENGRLRCLATARIGPLEGGADAHLAPRTARISRPLAAALRCEVDERLYVCDRRWWLGGLRSVHVTTTELFDHDQPIIELSSSAANAVLARRNATATIWVENHYLPPRPESPDTPTGP